ncbi:hypothetical protein S40288_06364 [Stachybotrys chartarum IBT 40288]|nr:hypothetical protein S40288_06364 [Stachybotrys chartarum IBT 40288]
MSNHIPDPGAHSEELPYCIWYPEVASEDTYRQLANRYPQMIYQVARGCAVAGYADLYLELKDVLPEMAVAEEARDAGSDAIFRHIMKQPVRYRIFDDYFRIINDNATSPWPAHLNGDTCVSSMLKQMKQIFNKPADPDNPFEIIFDFPGFEEDTTYNITEDYGVAESVPKVTWSSKSLMLDLLSSPLTADLPAGNKDLLILMAAFYGDTD